MILELRRRVARAGVAVLAAPALVAAFLLVVGAIRLEAAGDGNAPSPSDLSLVDSAVDKAKAAGAPEELTALARDLESRLADGQSRSYAVLIVRLCDRAGRWPAVATGESSPVLRAIVESALARTDEKVDVVTWARLAWVLVNHVQRSAKEDDADWVDRRRRACKTLLRAVTRVRAAIDPSWNPADRAQMPVLAVAPPPGVPGFPGMDPKAVQDPELRRQYEAAIEANRRKAEKREEQMALRDFDRARPQYILEAVGAAYRAAPANPRELLAAAEEAALTPADVERLRKAAGALDAPK